MLASPGAHSRFPWLGPVGTGKLTCCRPRHGAFRSRSGVLEEIRQTYRCVCWEEALRRLVMWNSLEAVLRAPNIGMSWVLAGIERAGEATITVGIAPVTWPL